VREDGYTLIELVVVMAILGVVVGGIVTLFAAGINADADQTRRYQSQEDGRVSVDRLRRDVHSSCAISNPDVYNTWESSATLYFRSDNCVSGSHSVSWCTAGSGNNYTLTRYASSTCSGSGARLAQFLTTNQIFLYLPPNAHVTTLGGGAGGIATTDGSYLLPRLHVDLQINRKPSNPHDAYRLVDDVVFRNSTRICGAGLASC
jgi:prepilin-type N-terminal cleavage/methylation domain-containing protein